MMHRGEREVEKMGEETSVKLLGYWSSAYSMRVELALKLKGIPYEYSDEDLRNKSELLLKSNPVHKKVPVLIHNGKLIAESLIILEYIDDTWSTNAPKLLPEDPYKKAQSRFWTSFVHQQLFDSMLPIALTEGEAQEKALKVFHDNLKVVEDGAGDLVAGGSVGDINEKNLGLLDIVLHSVLGPYKSFEEALGLKLIDQEKTPLIFSWLNALNELPTISQLILQTHDERVSHLKHFKQLSLKKPSS